MRAPLRSRRPAAEPAPVNAAGRPLDRGTRRLMERRFQTDFGAVRLHDDGSARRAAASVSASAFTRGPHVVFGGETPRLDSPRGQRLLAHELAHVVQQRRGVAEAGAVSRAGDADERAADRAAERVAAGEPAGPMPPATSGLQRQALPTPSLAPSSPLFIQSQAETIMESVLATAWQHQSKQQRRLKITPTIRLGLLAVLPTGVLRSLPPDVSSSRELLDRLRPSLPATIAPGVEKGLMALAEHEPTLPAIGFDPAADPAAPAFPGPAHALPAAPPDPRQPPEKGKGADEAAMKALEAAAETFRKTEVGKALEARVKSYVLSKEGIPLVALVAAGVVTFFLAEDPSLPSLPAVSLKDGIKPKIEINGKGSEMPALLGDLAHGRTEPGKPERKIGVSVTFTDEALGAFVRDAGHFFAQVGRAIGRGLVKAGTTIGHAVHGVLPEVLATVGGAAIGAGIGAVLGGGVGALIGAGIGAVIGLGAALVRRLVTT